jgi:hypothetical protein
VPYRSAAVRDLAWLIGSPSLMAEGTAGLALPPAAWLSARAAEAEPWLEALDDNPAELQRYLAGTFLAQGPHFRLGRQAERLLAFWMARRPGCELVAAGREVAADGHVLGELDVVFRDPERGLVHWEAAVKFYLRGEGSAAWDAYIGPNPRDRLLQKLRRVIDHQLPLGRDRRARIALGIGDQPLTSEAFLKGWLFYPADSGWDAPAFVPAGVHPDHGRGWWLRHGADEVPCAARSSRFLILARPDWLAPAHRPDDAGQRPLAHGELRAALARHFHDQHAAVLVAEVRRDEHGWWRELARGFVVHAHWPEVIPGTGP